MPRQDWIAIVEAAYRLDGSLEEWLGGLVRTARPILDHGDGTSAQAFALVPGGVRFDGVAATSPEIAREAAASIEGIPAQGVERVYRSPRPASSLSEALFGDVPEARARLLAVSGGRAPDVVGIIAQAGDGLGVAVNAPTREPVLLSKSDKARWRRVAPHVAGGYRLRRALAGLAPTAEDADVEAVLDPSGAVRDARASAASKSARSALHDAVVRAERARGGLRRSDPEEAMTLWEGLVRGRWSLVDLLDSDGRRFVVARRNDRGEVDPRGLTHREVVVCEQLGFGYAPKEIAYALGLAYTTVTSALASARRKLGIGSLPELAAFFAPTGLRQRFRELELAGEPLAFGELAVGDAGALARLTESEREVAVALLLGGTAREIAARRGVSERTVANQAQSIYRKLRVGSRAELAAKLSGVGAGAGPGPS